jgi:hypothetical protein
MGQSDLAGGNGSPGGTTPTGQPTQGTNPVPSAPAQGAQGGTQPGADTAELIQRLEKVESELTKTRAEAAKYRTKLKALSAEDGTDDKGDSKDGNNNAINAQIQTLKDARIRDQLTAAAREVNAHYPDTIWKLVPNLADISDDDGNLKDSKKILEGLRKAYPQLFKPIVDGPADGGATGSEGNPANMSDRIRADLARMRGR